MDEILAATQVVQDDKCPECSAEILWGEIEFDSDVTVSWKQFDKLFYQGFPFTLENPSCTKTQSTQPEEG